MKQFGFSQVAARYVSALFEVAQSASAIAQVEKDLNDFVQAIKDNESFANLLFSPLFMRQQQIKLMSALAEGFKAHPVTKAFLITLANQRRLPALSEIALQFAKLAEESRGEMTANIITAHVISKEDESQVATRLGAIYKKKVLLRTTQDAGLLGGVMVKVGGMQLDASLAGKLERMEQKLKAA